MTTESQSAAVPAPPSRRPRWLLVLLLVLAGAGAAGLAYRWWWQGPVIEPPEVPQAETDPRVVEAIEAQRTKVRQEPRSGEAWGRLGQILMAQTHYEPAMTCFAQAERFDPKNARWPYYQGLWRARRDPAAGVPLLQKAADLCDATDRGNTAPRLRLAEVQLEMDHPDQAKAEFQKVLARQPDNPRAQYGLGLVAAAADNAEEARGWLLQCARNPQTRQKAAEQLAKVFGRLGDTNSAAAAAGAARELPPDPPWRDPFSAEYGELAVGMQAGLRRAQLLQGEGRFAEALTVLRQTVDDYPAYETYLELAKALAMTRDRPATEAALRQACRLKDDQFEAPHLLSILLVDLAMTAEAKSDTRAAREYYREAAEFAQRAVSLKPKEPVANLFLGLALKGLGRRPEALKALQAAVKAKPDKADPYLALGEFLAQDGRTDEARKLLEEARRLARPGDPRPRQALERLDKTAAKP
jgi:tetratricopeptide (TPR) repeat protein